MEVEPLEADFDPIDPTLCVQLLDVALVLLPDLGLHAVFIDERDDLNPAVSADYVGDVTLERGMVGGRGMLKDWGGLEGVGGLREIQRDGASDLSERVDFVGGQP